MHAGYTTAQNRERKAKIREGKRIDEESKAARDYQAITAGEYIMFWEEAYEGDEEAKETFRGLSVAELRCQVVLGRALESWEAPAEDLRVHRFRQPLGDLNKGFVPGVLAGAGSKKWEVSITRASVLLIAPEFTAAKPLRLTAKTRKKLSEIAPVSNMYTYNKGTGITRGFAA